MVIVFDINLNSVLKKIDFISKKEFVVYDGIDNDKLALCEERYGNAKWKIAELINKKYGKYLNRPVDLYNWLFFRQDDEVSYFVCEMGANVIHHSGCEWPEKFEVYLGKKGFVIAVCQRGLGFNAVEVNVSNKFTQSGGGFSFLRDCLGLVFFDDPVDARVVYYGFLSDAGNRK